MVSFAVEKWSSALPELRPLFDLLWDEVALDKDKLKAKCNEEHYAKLESLDMLHLVVAREDNRVVSFFVGFVMPHMHYKDAGLFFFTDMHYSVESKRTGGLGAKMVIFLEQSLRERGIVKAYTSFKIHKPRPVFEALGWKPADVVLSKVIGEPNL